jgi:hypothetical protein
MTIRSPTEPTRRQVKALREVLRPRGLLRTRGDPEPVLAALVVSGDTGALRDLIAIALEQHGPNREACVAAVHALVKPLMPNRLPELDPWLRRSGCWSEAHWEDGWHRLRPGDITRLPVGDSAALMLVGLCASHPNGHVREAAVQRLAAAHGGEELAFLLVRVNDWVPAVRLKARTALLDRITPANATTLLGHLQLVDRLAQASRVDHQDIVEAVQAALQTDSARPVLLEWLRAPDFHVRRRCFELAGAAVGGTPAWLLDAAIADRDVLVRRRAYQRASELADEHARDGYLERAVLDPFAPIRRLAFQYWSVRADPVAERLCELMLCDRATELRADAQRWWKVRRQAPVVEFYRREVKVAQASRLVGALIGLAETGDSGDRELVHPFLAHRRTRVRRAALRALCRLLVDEDVPVFESALLGDTAAIAAEAERCLQRRVTQVDLENAWAKAAARPAGVRVRVLRVCRSLAKWRHLGFLLHGALDEDPTVRAFALRDLVRWLASFNRSFVALAEGERAALQALLARARPALPAGLSREIDFVLRGG